jgi:hypothetical protein
MWGSSANREPARPKRGENRIQSATGGPHAVELCRVSEPGEGRYGPSPYTGEARYPLGQYLVYAHRYRCTLPPHGSKEGPFKI